MAFHSGNSRRLCPLTESGSNKDDSRGSVPDNVDYARALLDLLAHPNIASKAAVIRIYDHEVQGGTVVKPLTGAADDGPSDAAVLHPIGTRGNEGIVLSNGINPEYRQARCLPHGGQRDR